MSPPFSAHPFPSHILAMFLPHCDPSFTTRLLGAAAMTHEDKKMTGHGIIPGTDPRGANAWRTTEGDPVSCFEKLKVLSVAELLAKAIDHVHSNESVSQLFETPPDD